MIIHEDQISLLRSDLEKARSQCGHWRYGMRVRNRINAVLKALEDEGVEASHEVLIVQTPLPGSTRMEPLLINICLLGDHIMMMEVDPKLDLRFGMWLSSVENVWRLSKIPHKLAWNSGLDADDAPRSAPTTEEAACFKELRNTYRNMVQACMLRQSTPTPAPLPKPVRL